MKLYSYYQSSASYRVRIALNLKNIAVDMAFVDLTKAEQKGAEYRSINPQQLVPALVLDDGQVLTQSLAIIQYLDENFSGPALLPIEPVARAKCRAYADMIAADIAPINNLKVRKFLVSDYGADEAGVKRWIQRFIVDGFTALEQAISASPLTGDYLIGNTPSMADCCLIPQVFNARRFEVDMGEYPTLSRIAATCEAHPAFVKAAPFNQPDAPKQAA